MVGRPGLFSLIAVILVVAGLGYIYATLEPQALPARRPGA